MAAVRLELFTEAIDEIVSAEEWYEARGDFTARASIDDAIATAMAFPYSGHEYLSGTRRLLVSRHPYALVYVVDGDLVTVVALTHLRRRPGYWRTRLR